MVEHWTKSSHLKREARLLLSALCRQSEHMQALAQLLVQPCSLCHRDFLDPISWQLGIAKPGAQQSSCNGGIGICITSFHSDLLDGVLEVLTVKKGPHGSAEWLEGIQSQRKTVAVSPELQHPHASEARLRRHLSNTSLPED